VESWKQRRLLISQPKVRARRLSPRSLACADAKTPCCASWQRLVAINAVLSAIFLTRAARDLATSQSWFLSIWNQLDLNGRVTSCAYFVFFCFWEFLPTVLLLCLISSKAGGVGGESLSLSLSLSVGSSRLTPTLTLLFPPLSAMARAVQSPAPA
jgi:hypothetical protein